MGYSGLGMQNWSYKRKLHKPFSKRDRVPLFYSLPLYSRTFTIKPKNKEYNKRIGFITFSTIVMIMIAICIFAKRFHNYTIEYSKRMTIEREKLNAEAFSFLINSGKYRLKSNNIHGAYSEFLLAYKIQPENEEIINLLIETSYILCEKDINYCETLEKYFQ